MDGEIVLLHLAKRPGHAVRSGGLRKARMALPGRGKSGSARVLYLWFPNRATIVLYLVYTKGDLETVPANQMKAIRHEVQRIKKTFGQGN